MFSLVVSFGGVTHDVDVTAIIPDSADFSLSVALELIARGERPPLVGGMTWDAREFEVQLLRPGGSALSGDDWWTFVAGLYSPLVGQQTLTVSHDGVTYETEVDRKSVV